MTRSGLLRTLLALSAILIAPSAAAKDSCPARKQKHSVESESSIAPRLPWPRPTLRFSATDPGMQKDCSPMPMSAAASAAFTSPFLIAMAAPTVYAHFAFSKQIGWVSSTILYGSMPLAAQIALHSSMEPMPYSFNAARILASRRS